MTLALVHPSRKLPDDKTLPRIWSRPLWWSKIDGPKPGPTAHLPAWFEVGDYSFDQPLQRTGTVGLRSWEPCGGDPEDDLDRISAAETVGRLLPELRPRLQRIVTLKYGLDGGAPQSLDDVGRAFDITRERVRQLLGEAMRELHHLATQEVAPKPQPKPRAHASAPLKRGDDPWAIHRKNAEEWLGRIWAGTWISRDVRPVAVILAEHYWPMDGGTFRLDPRDIEAKANELKALDGDLYDALKALERGGFLLWDDGWRWTIPVAAETA